MQGVSGYSAWRWIFIIEGSGTCVIAAISYLFIPDWPETAKFLNEEERAFLIRRLAADVGEAKMAKFDKKAIVRTVKDIKIWLRYIPSISGSILCFCILTRVLPARLCSSELQQLHIPSPSLYLLFFFSLDGPQSALKS